jgi:hypothetical protein
MGGRPTHASPWLAVAVARQRLTSSSAAVGHRGIRCCRLVLLGERGAMIRAGFSQVRFVVALALALGAVVAIRALVAHRHQERAAEEAVCVAAVVERLNHRDAQGLVNLLAAGHRQGDAAKLIAARDRIGPIATYSDDGVVEMSFNGVISERRIYALDGARASGRLELTELKHDGRWELVGIRLDDQEIPPGLAPPQGAPHGTIEL